MNTNHSTSELFFVFASTYCKLKVYDTEVTFIRKLLELAGVEILEPEERGYNEVDTRILAHLFKQILPKILETSVGPRFLPQMLAEILR